MKAILVIDMPKECDGCPCLNQKLWECQADKKRRSSDVRPSWCPLKLLRKKTPYGSDLFNDYVRGYNDCIDDIINGKK